MHIAYFDETGDDGYPIYSSEIFVLTSVSMHQNSWKPNYDAIHHFRRKLKTKYGLPIKQEFHTRHFITNKNPYHDLFSSELRRVILFDYCTMISELDVQIINVAINKLRINRPKYDVLTNALTYAVQRIENALNHTDKSEKFLIITDEGRISKMQKTTRKIQRINYIPSKFSNTSYRKDIEKLIEDPLQKQSSESYFIQVADTVSFIVHLFVKSNLCSPPLKWGNRIQDVLMTGDETLLLNILKKKINTNASRSNEYGIVYYPK